LSLEGFTGYLRITISVPHCGDETSASASNVNLKRNIIYEGVSKSFPTESITKYTITTSKKKHRGLWPQNSLDWLTK